MIGNNPQNKKGFTLIEVLVVMGLFTILGVLLINVFILSLRSQRQTAIRQETLANLRFVSETITRNIRTAEIDYGVIGDGKYDDDISTEDGGKQGIHGREKELYMIDEDGNEIAYFLEGGEIKISINGQESSMTNFEKIKIVAMDFYINPQTSPFIQERCNDSLVPTGCQPSIGCTVNESTVNDVRTGFCICDTISDPELTCATKNCDVSARPDPNEGLCLPFNEQPRVTLALAFESVGNRPQDIQIINFQTTASSRVYRR